MRIIGKVEYFDHEVIQHQTGDIHKKHFIIAGIERRTNGGYINQDKFHVIFQFKNADKVPVDLQKVGTMVTVMFDPNTRIWTDKNGKKHVSTENNGWAISVTSDEEQAGFEELQAKENSRFEQSASGNNNVTETPKEAPAAISEPAPATIPYSEDLPF